METSMTAADPYDEYLRDFDPSPQEPWEGYSDPLAREDWEALVEEGRQLASERDDLIQHGADPAQLLIPLHPAESAPWITDEVATEAVRQFGLVDYVSDDITDI